MTVLVSITKSASHASKQDRDIMYCSPQYFTRWHHSKSRRSARSRMVASGTRRSASSRASIRAIEAGRQQIEERCTMRYLHESLQRGACGNTVTVLALADYITYKIALRLLAMFCNTAPISFLYCYLPILRWAHLNQFDHFKG